MDFDEEVYDLRVRVETSRPNLRSPIEIKFIQILLVSLFKHSRTLPPCITSMLHKQCIDVLWAKIFYIFVPQKSRIGCFYIFYMLKSDKPSKQYVLFPRNKILATPLAILYYLYIILFYILFCLIYYDYIYNFVKSFFSLKKGLVNSWNLIYVETCNYPSNCSTRLS